MSTTITLNPAAKPAMATLVTLTTQMVMFENDSAVASNPALMNVGAVYRRACELWPASMNIAAAIVANTYSFTSATVDALVDQSTAP
jgi:hypothetical protein